MLRSHVVLGATLLLLAGCATGITVKHLTDDKPVRGNPWNLAMTQFNLTITRHVVSCDGTLKGNVEVIATASAVLDEDQRYVLESNGWWATSDITSTLAANGTSLGLNASSTDSTPTIISNVVGTVGQGFIAGASTPQLTSDDAICGEAVLDAVKKLYPAAPAKGLKQQVDDDTAALTEATAKVAMLTIKSGIDAAAFKKDLLRAIDEQDMRRQALAKRQRKLTQAMAATTHTQSVRWPPRASTFRTPQPLALDEAVLKRWLATEFDKIPDAKKLLPQIKEQFTVDLAIYRQDNTGAWRAPVESKFNGTKEGVPVRLARAGRLLACTATACPPDLPAVGSGDPRHTQFDQVVLQLGQMYTVPLTGGSFRAQTAVVAMDTNGLPTSIQVSENVAGAVSLTGALKDAATQIAALPGQISAAKVASVNAQTNILTAQTSQLNAQAALEAAQANAGVAGQTAPLAAQTALINAQNALATARANAGAQQTLEITAQTAMLNAQTALITSQANATMAPSLSALTAQTSLMNAETAQINAAAALAKARLAVTP